MTSKLELMLLVGGFVISMFGVKVLLAQSSIWHGDTAIHFQTIRTNIACIYVAGVTQTGLAIAAVRHEGAECK